MLFHWRPFFTGQKVWPSFYMTITENLFLTGSNVCSVEKTVKRTDKLLQSLTQDMRVGACTRGRGHRWNVKHVKSFMMTKPCFHNYISSLHHRQSCMMQPPGVGLSGNGAMLGRAMVGGWSLVGRAMSNEWSLRTWKSGRWRIEWQGRRLHHFPD